jgi:hypothetical protein
VAVLLEQVLEVVEVVEVVEQQLLEELQVLYSLEVPLQAQAVASSLGTGARPALRPA